MSEMPNCFARFSMVLALEPVAFFVSPDDRQLPMLAVKNLERYPLRLGEDGLSQSLRR